MSLLLTPCDRTSHPLCRLLLYSIVVMILLFTSLYLFMQTQIIFDFNSSADISSWRIVDDVVMGGRSSGHFLLTEEGHGRFFGDVSLENNGGFSSVRYHFDAIKVNADQKIKLRVKGDGSAYQMRVRDRRDRYYSFVYSFETHQDWEIIDIPLADMYPTFRGRKVDAPNFNHQQIEEIAILIGNKKAQSFELVIDYIKVEQK